MYFSLKYAFFTTPFNIQERCSAGLRCFLSEKPPKALSMLVFLPCYSIYTLSSPWILVYIFSIQRIWRQFWGSFSCVWPGNSLKVVDLGNVRVLRFYFPSSQGTLFFVSWYRILKIVISFTFLPFCICFMWEVTCIPSCLSLCYTDESNFDFPSRIVYYFWFTIWMTMKIVHFTGFYFLL